jgi:hypothetical protein
MTACFNKKDKTEEVQIDADEMIEEVVEEALEDLDHEEKEMIKEVLKNSEVKEELKEAQGEMMAMKELMVFFRDCLEDANSRKAALNCADKAEDLADDLELADDEEFDDDELEEEIGDWTDEDKKRILSEMDEALKFIEVMEDGTFFDE